MHIDGDEDTPLGRASLEDRSEVALNPDEHVEGTAGQAPGLRRVDEGDLSTLGEGRVECPRDHIRRRTPVRMPLNRDPGVEMISAVADQRVHLADRFPAWPGHYSALTCGRRGQRHETENPALRRVLPPDSRRRPGCRHERLA